MAGSEFRIKRVYEPPSNEDGLRVLADRLWPRGLSKESARIDHWARVLAPSNELRKWYGHEADKRDGFTTRYRAELDSNPDAVKDLLALIGDAPVVTLLFATKELVHNNAQVLKAYLDEKSRG